ncbi:aminopeptidase P family protein [Candidatus Woesearchaeota archaeon]|nr:aminopeptidase P family protein [Candidatus Woesearchaeota archaeon]
MIKQLQEKLSNNNLDLALFFDNDPAITYFTGIKPFHACLAVPSDGKPLLFVQGFEAERFARASTVEVVKQGKNLFEELQNNFPAKNIGINNKQLSFAHAQKIQETASTTDITSLCTELRLVKTEEEISRIKKACAITDNILHELFEKLSTLSTELDVANFLKQQMNEEELEPSFPPIVATASNAATPHHVPTKTKLKGFTVIDFGVVYKNYCSDITRTIYFGTPNNTDKELYRKVLQVQQESIKNCVQGNTLENINEEAHKTLGNQFIHRIGHSVGIEVHDAQPTPYTFLPGCIVTIEPGLYEIGKYGIRIEDDVLITKKESIVLTKTPKTLLNFT